MHSEIKWSLIVTRNRFQAASDADPGSRNPGAGAHVSDDASTEPGRPQGEDPGPEVHPAVAAAFRALDDASVTWALMRGADDLAAPSGDVDLLVDAGQMARTDEALSRAGLPRMGVRGHGSHRFYFRWDPSDRRWISLDVVPEIRFGRFQHLRTPLAPRCLERRRRVGGIWRLDPQDEAWLLLLHLVLDKRRLAPARRPGARTAAGVASITDPVARFLEFRIGSGAAAEVLEVCRRAEGEEFAEFASSLIRRWARRQPVRVPAAWLATLTARSLDLPITGHPPGLVVALAGSDGARRRDVGEALLAAFPGPRRVARSSLAARVHRRLGRLVVVGRASSSGSAPDLVLALGAPGQEWTGSSPWPTAVVLDPTRSADTLVDDAMTAIWARLSGSMASRQRDQE
jgi:hypothetical protein